MALQGEQMSKATIPYDILSAERMPVQKLPVDTS